MLRSTPTRVGKTQPRFYSPSVSEVHPHACGENFLRPNSQLDVKGPPPRVWGKRHYIVYDVESKRSTPTRVGKTSLGSYQSLYRRVHPHACGENFLFGVRVSRFVGPPPRVWGKRSKFQINHNRPSVHPHACGENMYTLTGRRQYQLIHGR